MKITDLRDEIDAVGPQKAFDDWTDLSPAGRDLLAGLLSFNPGERLTAAEALKHRWFTEKAEASAAAKPKYPGFGPLFSKPKYPGFS
ncbi:hypothetical protein ACP4OV_005049 [Aristida adscensionis]